MTAPIGQTSIPEMCKVQVIPGMTRRKEYQPRNTVYQKNMQNIIEERNLSEYNYFLTEPTPDILNTG